MAHSLTESDRARTFTRRALMVGGLQLGVFTLMASRLYQLQVSESSKYHKLAEENRIATRLLLPRRGIITDRQGIPLSANQPNFSVIIEPEPGADIDKLLQKLTEYIPLTAADFKRIDRAIARGNVQNGVLVSDTLSWEQAATIEVHYPDLAGSRIEENAVRVYPYGAAMTHILGYTGVPAEADMGKDPLLNTPGYRLGKSGLEQHYDQLLQGLAGRKQLEVDAHGKIVRELDQQLPVAGQDLRLSLDLGLQEYVQQRLASEESAAAVIIDCHTGGICALASHPGFDPNLFTYGIAQAEWDKLNNDPNTPLINKVIAGQYAPGSVFKIVTALAALEARVVRPKDTVYCPGHLDLGNHRFHCWKRGGHGAVNLVSALAGSCDTYFYDIGQRTGIDRLQAMAQRLGLGQRTGIDLPHERGGFMPNRTWKRAALKEEWQQGETLISAIGQGYVLTTPLQLAVMLAAVANGETVVTPSLYRAADQPPPTRRHEVAPELIAVVRQAINAVVNTPAGTAYQERIIEPGLSMAGKTGTSQVRRISKAERSTGVIKNEKLAWEQRDHALFAGYAPAEAPRYAFAVLVEHGGSGAHVAAPIARDIMTECLKRNPAG